jgi:hypothetical protein
LHDDLLELVPLKGNFHMHSEATKGYYASVRYLLENCRSVGFDFMTLTDRMQREPSLLAAADYEKGLLGLGVFPGEELVAPGTTIRIVSFGARAGIAPELADTTAFNTAVECKIKGWGLLPAGVDARAYAATVLCCERIRALGGLSILCIRNGSGRNRMRSQCATAILILQCHLWTILCAPDRSMRLNRWAATMCMKPGSSRSK